MVGKPAWLQGRANLSGRVSEDCPENMTNVGQEAVGGEQIKYTTSIVPFGNGISGGKTGKLDIHVKSQEEWRLAHRPKRKDKETMRILQKKNSAQGWNGKCLPKIFNRADLGHAPDKSRRPKSKISEKRAG